MAQRVAKKKGRTEMNESAVIGGITTTFSE